MKKFNSNVLNKLKINQFYENRVDDVELATVIFAHALGRLVCQNQSGYDILQLMLELIKELTGYIHYLEITIKNRESEKLYLHKQMLHYRFYNKIYVLISVCDREILAETFKSLPEAQQQMHNEMSEWADVDPMVFSNNNEYEDDDFGFGEWSAWANTNSDFDWRILCIGGKEK